MQNPRLTFQVELRLQTENEVRRRSAAGGVFFWLFVAAWSVAAFWILRELIAVDAAPGAPPRDWLAYPVLAIAPLGLARAAYFAAAYFLELRDEAAGKSLRERLGLRRGDGWAMTWGIGSRR